MGSWTGPDGVGTVQNLDCRIQEPTYGIKVHETKQAPTTVGTCTRESLNGGVNYMLGTWL